jgi:hypothetical protein
MTPWTRDQPDARPLPARRTTRTQNKLRQTFMTREGFEPTISMLERAKTLHVLYRAATVMSNDFEVKWKYKTSFTIEINVHNSKKLYH